MNATTTPSEQADARYDAAHEQATTALNAADLFDELTEAECVQLVAEALMGRPTHVLSDVAERIVHRQTGELLAEASRLARVAPLRIEDWYATRLLAEARSF